MNDFNQLRERINKAQAELVEYQSLLRPFIELLDALEDSAISGLATIAPDKLLRHQGVIAQLRALKAALRDPSRHSAVAT